MRSVASYDRYLNNYFIFNLHKPNPIRMKPVMINDMYTGVTAIARYKFKPKVGSIIFVTAKRVPPAINNNVVIFVFCLNPNPNDIKNRNTEERPRNIPLCLSVRFKNPFPPCDVNTLIVSKVKSMIAVIASASETFLLPLNLRLFDCLIIE
jgi:hypothetical protein